MLEKVFRQVSLPWDMLAFHRCSCRSFTRSPVWGRQLPFLSLWGGQLVPPATGTHKTGEGLGRHFSCLPTSSKKGALRVHDVQHLWGVVNESQIEIPQTAEWPNLGGWILEHLHQREGRWALMGRSCLHQGQWGGPGLHRSREHTQSMGLLRPHDACGGIMKHLH